MSKQDIIPVGFPVTVVLPDHNGVKCIEELGTVVGVRAGSEGFLYVVEWANAGGRVSVPAADVSRGWL
jgi:hypothetical protein